MKSDYPKKIALLTVCAVTTAAAYEVDTHKDISRQAVAVSTLSARLPDMGLSLLTDRLPSNSMEVGGPVFCIEGVGPRRRSVIEIFAHGAFCEDSTFGADTTRYVFHFYDPAHGGAGWKGFSSSLTWGLEQTNIATQNYSYKDAREYFYNGLTQTNHSVRDENMALTFRSIGHVMHLIQDLAQPQHTRGDSHGTGSLYEQFTNSNRKSLQFQGYAPVNVSVPIDLWHTGDNKGLADYSNRGFVTAGTNFRGTSDNILPAANFALPDGANASIEKRQITDLDMLGPAGAGQPLVGEIQFVTTSVSDEYGGSQAVRSRASSLSLFDAELKSIGANMVFTQNRFNFVDAQKLLIPRAVGYSAGLINFFFRGKMEISLPDEGVYAAVDHTIENVKDTGGFRTIRAKVKNVTPRGAGIEPMSASGKFRAVAKFHRNKCYQPDLSKEFGSPGVDWKTCRTRKEGIGAALFDIDDSAQEFVVSDEVSAPADINGANPQSLTFSFPTPIPINATDLFLQVVYRGPLGDEPDAVAVVTKDISEPTYLYKYDTHDQFMYARYPALAINGGGQIYTWPQWCGQAISDGVMLTLDECNARLWPAQRAYQFSATDAYIPGWDPANPPAPLGEWSNISQQPPTFNPLFTLNAPVGSYSRVAYLTDTAPTNKALQVDDWNGTTHLFAWATGVMPAARNQLDPVTKSLTPTQRWAPARGIYVSPSDAQLIGAPSNVGVLKPQQAISGSSNPF